MKQAPCAAADEHHAAAQRTEEIEALLMEKLERWEALEARSQPALP